MIERHTMYRPHAMVFGGFSPNDATIDFYLRINSLARPDAVYLDYGAGRASWFEKTDNPIQHSLRDMRGKFAEVIGADIDGIVFENPAVDRAFVITNERVPLPDASVDVIVADFVIEHVQTPATFAAEVSRLLKPGGWFCARTPHRFHYVALADRLLPKRLEHVFLRRAQPQREERDVFEKMYRMNTLCDVAAAFPGWTNRSFLRRCDPAYFFGRRSIHAAADFAHRIMPTVFSGNLFLFLQKPDA